ncbi:MAG: DUF1800 family protein [Hyphomicrobiales bacterium]|nr:DUF1800 family protein [Hyphomicrobiales bacterium]
MANDPKSGWTALNRFGFGARGDGDLAAAAADPRGFLLAEVDQPGIALLDGPGLASTPSLLKALFDEQEKRRLEREGADRAKIASALQVVQGAEPPQMQMAATGDAAAPTQAAKPPPSVEQIAYRAEALARVQRATAARAGFVERLVCFWSNHFCVSVAKGQFIRVSAGAFEREAIRPHALGRFVDMLKAVEQHPSMIFYLDNQQSIGPESKAGLNRKRGLNENLAREIMELHTLGVDGGYTQADVTAFARVITGWTFVGREGRLGPPGSPLFFANFHEPGAQTVFGKTYSQSDREQGLAVLDDLARAPATARHIATKFAKHFVADDPPPALVDRLAQNFTATQGDLKALAKTLIASPEAWSAPAAKLRNPYEFLVASARVTGRTPVDAGPILGGLATLGQPLWSPAGPNGFADTAASWISPEGMKARLDISWQIASRIPDMANPVDMLDKIAGAAASTETRQAVARAESKQQALALLLMSPEMQRR